MARPPKPEQLIALEHIRRCMLEHWEEAGPRIAKAEFARISKATWSRWVAQVRAEDAAMVAQPGTVPVMHPPLAPHTVSYETAGERRERTIALSRDRREVIAAVLRDEPNEVAFIDAEDQAYADSFGSVATPGSVMRIQRDPTTGATLTAWK
ncbi:MAG TPA: hypothetical protein VL635_07645 [Trinickia sp.]|jgi:hypothetical protein|nr:hypothetical protein [Trinickia sp.]